MELHRFKVKRLILKKVLTWLVLGCLGSWLVPVTPALAQGPGGALLEKPPAEKKKRRELLQLVVP